MPCGMCHTMIEVQYINTYKYSEWEISIQSGPVARQSDVHLVLYQINFTKYIKMF